MEILTMKGAATLLRKSPAALRSSYRRWGVPHFWLGGQTRFVREQLEAWLQTQTENAHGRTELPKPDRPHDRRYREARGIRAAGARLKKTQAGEGGR